MDLDGLIAGVLTLLIVVVGLGAVTGQLDLQRYVSHIDPDTQVLADAAVQAGNTVAGAGSDATGTDTDGSTLWAPVEKSGGGFGGAGANSGNTYRGGGNTGYGDGTHTNNPNSDTEPSDTSRAGADGISMPPTPGSDSQLAVVQDADVTLEGLAHALGVEPQTLQQLNPHIDLAPSRRLPVGTQVIIPFKRQQPALGSEESATAAPTAAPTQPDRDNSSSVRSKRASDSTRGHFEPQSYETYYVRRGDTLSSIARWYGISVEQLMKANSLGSSRIYAGQQLRIPMPWEDDGVTWSNEVPPNNNTGDSQPSSVGNTVGNAAASVESAVNDAVSGAWNGGGRAGGQGGGGGTSGFGGGTTNPNNTATTGDIAGSSDHVSGSTNSGDSASSNGGGGGGFGSTSEVDSGSEPRNTDDGTTDNTDTDWSNNDSQDGGGGGGGEGGFN